MQLTKDQRTSIVQKFNETKNCEQVRTEFEQIFSDRTSPIKIFFYQIVRKFSEHGTILSRNKGNSGCGSSRTQRTEGNIERVRQLIEENRRQQRQQWRARGMKLRIGFCVF